jgi:hypothetical protein
MNVRAISLTMVGIIVALFGALIYGAGPGRGMTTPSQYIPNRAPDRDLLPVIGQVYLISLIWMFTATFFNLYTIALFLFVCLLVLFVIILETRNS